MTVTSGAAPSGGLGGRIANLPRPRDLARFCRAILGADRSTVARAFIDGVRVTLVLKRRGVRDLLTGGGRPSGTTDVHRASAVSRQVDIALAVLPLASTCLRRSLVLLRELRRLGLHGALHVGVRNVGTRPEAHAWIEVDGAVINDDPALIATYTQLAAGDLERLVPMLQ